MKLAPLFSMLLVLAGFLTFGPVARAADDAMVDSPVYLSWAKHKPGTKVVMSMNTETMGQKMKGEMTYTLLTVTPDQVTVEMMTKMEVMGQSHTSPGQKTNFAAKVKKQDASSMPAGVHGESKDAGSETITIGGKPIDCKIVEYKGENEKQHAVVTGKSWASEDVPGNLVKNVMHAEGTMAADITMTVISMDLK